MTKGMSNSTDRRWPEGGPARVPFWVYSDPEIYARERQRIFAGQTWSYVALEAEIPNVGDFITTAIGDMPVVIVRDEDGGITALPNRCAHRGVAFCRHDHGNVRSFVCPYHQWTYDLKGRLLGVPFRHGYQGRGGMEAGFRTEEHGLEPLKVAVRNGAVFASFDPAVEPFEAYLGPKMLGYFDRVFDGRKLTLLGYMRQRIPCNWKLMVENLKDPYHASVLHVFLITFGLFRLDQESAVEMDETGRHGVLISRRGPQALNEATRQMSNFRADLALEDPRLIDPVPEFPPPATVVMQTLWPNLIVQQQSNTLAMRQIVPRGPGQFDLNWTFFGYEDDPPALRQRRIRQANLMGPAGLVSIDDSEVIAMSQLGAGAYPDAQAFVETGGRGVTDADTMVTEAGMRGLYQHYIEVMGL
jgi:salicylate 5-hydroxylase large subunit